MNAAPTDTNPAPCAADYPTFLSTDIADHRLAKELCAECPFTSWCVGERENAAVLNGRTSIEGTWHGTLWVDGVLSIRGKVRPGRPRKVEATA